MKMGIIVNDSGQDVPNSIPFEKREKRQLSGLVIAGKLSEILSVQFTLIFWDLFVTLLWFCTICAQVYQNVYILKLLMRSDNDSISKDHITVIKKSI